MSGNEELENTVLKSVFLVTVKQGENGFTYLSKLAKNETTITTSDDRWYSPAEDLIPCDLCNKMIPFSYFSEHQVICMQGGVDYIPVTSSAPKTVTITSDPITRLNRSLIQRMILEKSPYAAGGLQYLMDCTDRANKLQPQYKDNKFASDLLADIKREIITGLKTLLIQEQTTPQENSLYSNNQPKSELLFKYDIIPEQILADLIQSCQPQELDTIFSVVIFELTFAVQVQVRDFDAFHPGLAACYQRVNRLLNHPQIINLLAVLIDEEITQSKNWSGSDFEKNSVLSKYFFLNSMGQVHAKKYFGQIPKYPDASFDEIKLMQKSLQGAIKGAIEMNHFNLKKIFLAKDNGKAKNSLLNWFSVAIKLNDSKADLSPTDPFYLKTLALYGSDPFLVNMHCCLLEFCKPFLDTNFSKESLISPYYCAYSKRLDFANKSKLAKLEKFYDFNIDQKLKEGEFSFVSEIFFLTLVSMHVGLMPAIRVYNSYQQALINSKNLQQKQIALYGELYANTPEGQQTLQNLNLYYLIVDGYCVHVTHPEYMTLMHNLCMQFMHWMLKIYNDNTTTEESKNIREAIFATMPEYFIEDVIDYLTFVGRCEPNVFTPQMLEVMVNFCSTFVSDSKLIRSAIIRAKFLELLTEINFLGNQKPPAPPANYGFGFKQPPSTPILMEPLKSQFRDALHSLKNSRQSLISGLFVLYCDVDSAVEGLDVDRHKFDKYVVRKGIATLVNQLWNDPEYRKVITSTLDVNQNIPFFKADKFLGTVLSDSIMLLDDSLSRLADIKELQVAMANVDEWNKQLPERIRQREQYYEGQERSSRAFLNLANSILDFLVNLTKDYVEPFTKSPEVVTKLVSTINHFFEELCGPRMLNLKVKNPEKYNFNPRELLRKIVTLTLSFAREPEFVTVLGKDLEYSPQIMQKALQIVSRERLVGEDGLNVFGELIAKVNSIVQPNELRTNDTVAEPMDVEEEFDREKEMELEKIYVEALKPLIFDSFVMSKEDGDKITYNHHYSNNIISSQSSSKDKMQRLAKECGSFDSQLPISRGSSIFVRTDEERMDVMKAVITGPKGTPYGSGCFVFDIFFPATYPQDPPLLNLATTGNGTARFNPNLYTDGKVCLSLLGTWHGDASSKWNAVSSNLQQVLISIQGLIMVEEPYFNEPSYEAQRGTKEGDKRSHEYNENIQYNNIRFAMIEQLRNPPAEFAEVINLHFKLEKDAIIKQCEKWMKEASIDMKSKFSRVIDELKKELAKL